METDSVYVVVKQSNAFCVVDHNHRTIVSCQDELNARHYAELLNKAYKSGYKTGYKAGKNAS